MNGNPDFILKLFDTLKDASDQQTASINKMIDQQNDLVSHVKALPMADLKEALKDHAKQSTDDIDSCTETVETKTGDILDIVRKIDNKVTKMILVVAVAFTILTGGFLVIKAVTDHAHTHTTTHQSTQKP